jgi:hypothetical protein
VVVVSANNFAGDDQSPGAQLLSDRIVAVARLLVDFGLPLHQIGPKLFEHLTAPDADARSRLFRAGLGLRGQRSRREASALADHAERGVRGPYDRVFGRRFVCAHARNRILQAAHDQAETQRPEGVAVTRDNLRLTMMMLVGRAKWTELVLRNPPIGCSVETMIEVATTDYFSCADGG